MSAAKDGGPAFPAERTESIVLSGFGDETATVKYSGMSLRDYFAGQALSGLMCGKIPGTGTIEWQAHAAWDAYSVADTMLAERAKAGEA